MVQTQSTVSEALKILSSCGVSHAPSVSQSRLAFVTPKKSAPASPKENEAVHFDVLKVAELSNPALLAYLAERKINLDIARKYGLREIYFKNPKTEKTNFALAWPSGDGHEIRNRLFKGFVGSHKDITIINPSYSSTVSVFEGWSDFLSFLTMYKLHDFKSSAIILNSVSLKAKALEWIQLSDSKKLYLFLDNDEAGHVAKQYYQDSLKGVEIIDKSAMYAGFNDLNQLLMKSK